MRNELTGIVAQRDTLLVQNEKAQVELDELHLYIEVMSSSLDSIAKEEGMLFMPDPENPGKKLSNRQLQQRFDRFQELIDRQRNKIKMLEDSLDIKSTSLNNMKILISYFRQQIELKDVEITKMKKELKSQRATVVKLEAEVSEMQANIDVLNADVTHLLDKSEQQSQILDTQDSMLNEGYYIVKSKSELQSMGIRAQNLSNANLDLSSFTKVDIREFTTLEISADVRKIKILTQMPVGSYSFEADPDGSTVLKIDSPVDFWCFSKILVIQTR